MVKPARSTSFVRILIGSSILLAFCLIVWNFCALPNDRHGRTLPDSGHAAKNQNLNSSSSFKANSQRGPRPKAQKKEVDPNDDLNQWRSRISGIKPIEASHLLEQIKRDVSSLSLRAEIASDIISELIKNGETKAAWNLLDSTYGAVRDGQVKAFFERVSDPVARLDFFRRLDTNDKLNALDGILQNIGVTHLEQLRELPLVWDNSTKKFIAYKLAGAFDVPFEARQEAWAAEYAETATRSMVALFNAGLIDATAVNVALDTNNYYPPGKILAILDEMASESNPLTLESCYEKFLKQWVSSDSSGAMEAVLKRSELPTLMGAIVSKYFSYDSTDAARWFIDASKRMTPAQHDQGALVFVDQALRNGEISAAEAWVATLKSDGLRQQATKKIGAIRAKSNKTIH